jgi:hypothetical protein
MDLAYHSSIGVRSTQKFTHPSCPTIFPMLWLGTSFDFGQNLKIHHEHTVNDEGRQWPMVIEGDNKAWTHDDLLLRCKEQEARGDNAYAHVRM